jgi:hypothetical protein
MSLRERMARRRLKRRGPIGKVSGLLTASAVTLIGLAVGLEPHVILWRAFVSGVLIGSLVAFGVSVIHVANVTRTS